MDANDENRRRMMEATILLLGWEPIIKSFDEKLRHRDRGLLLSLSLVGRSGYATISDARQIASMVAAETPTEMRDWSDLRIGTFYQRVMEIEHESQN